MAVPVRADLLATVADLSARQARGWRGTLDRRDQRLRDFQRGALHPAGLQRGQQLHDGQARGHASLPRAIRIQSSST